eukprot:13064-Chlamydomonas_euryale.AAC.3
MSLLGGEMQNCTSAILAFSIRVGPPAVLAAFWSNTRPSTISESSTVPPGLATMRMSFRSSMLGRAGSMTFSTASTAMDENNPLYCDTTLLLRELRRAVGTSGGLVRGSGDVQQGGRHVWAACRGREGQKGGWRRGSQQEGQHAHGRQRRVSATATVRLETMVKNGGPHMFSLRSALARR